jgi:hypothetical protein
MDARVPRTLKVIAFTENSIWKQLSKLLQDVHIDVFLLSQTNVISHGRFLISNNHFYRTGRFPGKKEGNCVVVKKRNSPYRADLPFLVSIEATGVCIRIGNCEMLFAAACVARPRLE